MMLVLKLSFQTVLFLMLEVWYPYKLIFFGRKFWHRVYLHWRHKKYSQTEKKQGRNLPPPHTFFWAQWLVTEITEGFFCQSPVTRWLVTGFWDGFLPRISNRINSHKSRWVRLQSSKKDSGECHNFLSWSPVTNVQYSY